MNASAKGDVALGSFIQDIRKLCRNLAELLGTAERLFSDEGWDRISHDAFRYSSAQIKKHEHWFPNEVFMVFEDPDRPQVVAYVSVLLDDRGSEYDSLKGPLLTGGWIDFGLEHQHAKKWSGWYARFHGYMEDRKDDGVVRTINPRELWPDDRDIAKTRIERVSTLGVPLIEASSSGDLHKLIVKPLLDHVREAVESSEDS